MNLNLDNFWEQLRFLNSQLGVSRLLELRDVGAEHTLSGNELIIISVVLAVGLLICLAGLVLARFWAGVVGFGLGATAGSLVASFVTADRLIIGIVALIIGAGVAFLASFFYRVGLFILAWAFASLFFFGVLNPNDWVMVLVCVVIGLVAAIVTLRYPIPVIILTSALLGALIAEEGVRIFLNYEVHIQIIVLVVLTIVGILIQIVFENGKRKRHAIAKANETQATQSRANDIDRARDLLDDIDEPEIDSERVVKAVAREEKIREKEEKAEKAEAKEAKAEAKEAKAEAKEEKIRVKEEKAEAKEAKMEAREEKNRVREEKARKDRRGKIEKEGTAGIVAEISVDGDEIS